jgi:hypothetical protein
MVLNSRQREIRGRYGIYGRGMHVPGIAGLGAGAPAQVANGPDGPFIMDAHGNTVYTASQVAADPSLLSLVSSSASGCPPPLVPTWTMAGTICAVPGAGSGGCLDPTGVCGSYQLPTQSNPCSVNDGWVLDLDGQWTWCGPGTTPTTPSPGAINELATTYVPAFSAAAGDPGTTIVSPGAPAPPVNALVTNAPQSHPLQQQPANNALANAANQTTDMSKPADKQPAPADAAPADVTIGGVDIVEWIKQNWIVLAAAAGGLLVFSMAGKGRS